MQTIILPPEWWQLKPLCDCPRCGRHTIVELPPLMRLQQPDDTTHVCDPTRGGCNHGFTDGRTREAAI